MTVSIGILGLGAVGTLMAHHWQQHCLYALTRQQQEASCRLEDEGSLATLHLPAWQGESLDWLLVCTKAAATLDALQLWRPRLAAVKRLLLLQNGMGQHQQVQQWLDQQGLSCELWAAISTEGAWRRDDGVIVRAGKGEILAGRIPISINSEKSPDTTVTAPAPCKTVDNIQQYQREKLAVNAVINPLTALYRCRNGELLEHPDYYPHFKALCAEIGDLYQQLGWPLAFDPLTRISAVAKATATNRSSTLQDHLAGRPDELAYITGYLLEQAAAATIELPLCAQLWQQVRGEPHPATLRATSNPVIPVGARQP
ncbi:ketopantoate reductase family protein [Parathalassolituus penaei]|uniref:2-dehydropantoate 2-reductase n=1 Tax=Parathalassolituus penaei TaxID=2997323 RepID=A0A9X3IRH8_9GAMM|nr:2-dehydropantoate 2-reductase [Parathalassolituus penaei]MCY0963864.1 2-dehydropantoate 2-reductase [Parathalassolituus penaei]